MKAEAVADHYRKPPSVKSVEMRFTQEPATIMAMLKSGEADIVQIPPASNIPEVRNDPKLRIVWSKYGVRSLPYLLGSGLSQRAQCLSITSGSDKPRSYAINRKAITRNLLNGAAEPWGT